MRLKRLDIKMFKGIRSFLLEAEGESVRIYGGNATGKTTLADAVSWLLFNKDTQDKSPLAFGIKTVDENGNVLHGEEHTVEAVFILDDGQELALKKVYKEKWTTKRSTNEKDLSHTTDHYWDEEPIKDSEYKARLEKIMSETEFKMFTLPNYFAEVMHWTDRRNMLTLLCGDIDDEQIVGSNPKLNGYMQLLDGKTKEAVDNILRERKKKLNKEIDSIPSRIDENQMKIVDVEQTVEQAETSIDTLKADIESKQEKITQVNAGGGVADMQVKLQEIEAEKQQAINEHREKTDGLLVEKREKVSELRGLVDETEGKLRSARSEYSDAEQSLVDAKSRVEKTESLIEQEKAKQPEPQAGDGGPDNCPMCEQPLPKQSDEDAEKQYKQYVEGFNSKKAEELKRLNELRGDAVDVMVQADADVDRLKEQGTKLQAQLSQRKQALEKAEQAVKSVAVPDLDTTPFENKKQAIEKKISELRGNRQEQVDEIKAEISALKEQIEEHQDVIATHKQNKQAQQRISELKEMLKKYGNELDKVEKNLMLLEEFDRAKAEYITDKVNDKFDYVNWRLFKEQLNGGLQETCDPLVDGVPYSEGLNNAARIRAGLDIINTLSNHIGKSAPVWIDNAESIIDIPEYNNMQILALYVSEQDSKLRVELNQESKMAVA